MPGAYTPAPTDRLDALASRMSASRPGDVYGAGDDWFVVIDAHPFAADGPMTKREAYRHAADFAD